jgi:adenylate cyclase class 2
LSQAAHDEVEIKLAVSSASAARALLETNGFQVKAERVFESNLVFDTPTGALRSAARLLRLRLAASVSTLTFKDTPVPGPHKSREEIETTVDNPFAMAAILQRLGFEVSFRYEKYRTVFARPDEPGVVTLDETPIGIFLEIEGPPEWIDSTARRLGFSTRDYITASYGRLFLDWCAAHRIESNQMVFSTEPDAASLS